MVDSTESGNLSTTSNPKCVIEICSTIVKVSMEGNLLVAIPGINPNGGFALESSQGSESRLVSKVSVGRWMTKDLDISLLGKGAFGFFPFGFLVFEPYFNLWFY